MKNKKYICAIFLALFPAWIFCACSQAQSGPKDRVKSPRIVSLAPSLTETVFILGMGNHLVGVTSHCNFPPEAKTRSKMGGLKTISLEAVLAQESDIVFATKDSNEFSLIEEMIRLGLNVRTYQPRNLDEILQAILLIGKDLGVEARAETVVKELKAKEDYVSKSVANLKPVPTMIVYERQPLVLAGPGTFADDLIAKAGGINLAGNAPNPYPRYSMEKIIEQSPEVIIDVSMEESDGAEKQAKRFWREWQDLPAVKNNKVAALNSDLITRPGPRLFDGLLELAKILHSEKFEEKN